MKTKHPNIKFISVFEENESFSFLDVKITRMNNQLVTSVFRKATFSGVFTNFKSFLSVGYKFGLVYILLHRSFSICSSYEKFHEEIVWLKDILKKNEYPQFFRDKCIKKKYLSKLLVPKRIVHTVHKKQVLLVLPILGPLSFEIRSRLQKCFKNYISYCSLKVVCQSRRRISNLFNFKDVVNTKLSSHTVYKFMCSCWNATYYGQTQRHFFVRASEHLGITPLTGKFVKTPKKSAIDHALLEGHKASFDNFSILLKESNPFKLQLKESLFISRDESILNKNIFSFPLELFDWLWHCYLIFIVIFVMPCRYIIIT